ncbi:alpha/beta fold hydrolase [Nocardia cyriacigeorgica]|uniref:alpha/beta fold hydrolase n=1 Tax=Nocardia cyriacigeorgica TaxID=135487 RepID=UPI001893D7BB|nr:alpha/beta hydrolase [Nocardia cyriacigeorgica]MBF6452371.1 alpha/beta hydrolase [Nocardia cyriacigeorgica]MBF6480448.1 alpha/beta hydrolase [Nocardia cyriacigeorgica]MBF6549540.1 alpha/beta hydrolase [Nocardia cyriacigeorgica]
MSITSTMVYSAERHATVSAVDGVALAVREYGPRHAGLTVVLVHGHCLRGESWTDVRDALLRENPGVRVVCYDHRGHGGSAVASSHTYHLDRLGRDLRTVLDAVAPTGPVVLVGHSMGGMTVLTYASQNPHEIGNRIVGVGLIATAASGLADAGFGRLLRHPIIAAFQAAVRRAPRLMQRAKRVACKIFAPVIRIAEFGDRQVSPRVLALAYAMHNETPIVTMASFLSSFMTYDRTDVLPVLSKIPTLILCGSADLMTPPSHSVAMAAAIDYADLVMVEGAGHSVILEQPVEVAEGIGRLLARAEGPGRAVTADLVLAA